jgi:tripartite-type tricarboxylate transporter receptor subunit TctC
MILGETMSKKFLILIVVAALACTADAASAQTYPVKPIRILVGFLPGGPADVMARLISPKMSVTLGQSVVVDNRGGAGGTIAARAVAESEPDGYTLLLGNTSTLVISPLIYKNIGYDPLKAFAPIARIGVTSNLMVANPKAPFTTVKELIAYAKANPGKLNYSSAGIGTPPHLIGEMFKHRAGIDVVHIPYKGGGPSIQAVVAGETQYSFENSAIALPQAEGGTLRAVAITSETRSAQAPNVPTMIEAGLPDFASVSFTGVVAPAGVPPAIVARLNAVINEALKTPEVRAVLAKQAVDVQNETPAQFGAFLAKELERLAPVVKAAGIVGE